MAESTPHAQSNGNSNRRRQYVLFLGAVILLSAGMGLHESVFNNFLDDTFGIGADDRGMLEFPRELPGFLVVFFAGALALLPVTRLGVVGGAVMAAGLAGMAFLGGMFGPMILMMIVTSAGMHLLMPVGSSIAIGLSDENTKGKHMGQMGAVATVGGIFGFGFVWLFFDKASGQYRTIFLLAAAVTGVAAVVYSFMHIPHLHKPRSRLVFRKKFLLYYLLELLFGARKQIFITFGMWVLVTVYGEGAGDIAKLMLIGAVIGIAFKPLAGMAIDRFGERVILVLDALVLAFVCVGYGFAIDITGDIESARRIAYTCFVLDNLLFSLGMGRAIYASRIADDPQELTSTLSMGVSVNHVASMTVPAFMGALWMARGYQWVFFWAGILALVIAACCSRIPPKARSGGGS